jgi:tRNA A37 threonylcarbamoyltransferase TsaD
MDLTTDNAAMIGIAAAYHLDDITNYENINADANLKL